MDNLNMLTLDDDELRTVLLCLTLIQTNATQELFETGDASSLKSVGLNLTDLSNIIGRIQKTLDAKNDDV